jgi:hypothetical protein
VPPMPASASPTLQGECFRVRVHDDGEGFTHEARAPLSQPFWTSRVGGLGLAWEPPRASPGNAPPCARWTSACQPWTTARCSAPTGRPRAHALLQRDGGRALAAG